MLLYVKISNISDVSICVLTYVCNPGVMLFNKLLTEERRVQVNEQLVNRILLESASCRWTLVLFIT